MPKSGRSPCLSPYSEISLSGEWFRDSRLGVVKLRLGFMLRGSAPKPSTLNSTWSHALSIPVLGVIMAVLDYSYSGSDYTAVSKGWLGAVHLI